MIRRHVNPLSAMASFTETAEVLCAHCGPELFMGSTVVPIRGLEKCLPRSVTANYGVLTFQAFGSAPLDEIAT